MGAFWLCFVCVCTLFTLFSHFISADEQEDDFPGRVGSSLRLSKLEGNVIRLYQFCFSDIKISLDEHLSRKMRRGEGICLACQREKTVSQNKPIMS